MYDFMPANKKKKEGQATLGTFVFVVVYLKIKNFYFYFIYNLGHIIIKFKEKYKGRDSIIS